jgi:hypothetical protein
MNINENAPLLFLHVGWMVRYAGADPTDPARGNFGWLHSHIHGYEAFNFLPRSGRLYGYAQSRGQLRIERLGAHRNDDYVDGITVIWIAGNPSTNKTVIVDGIQTHGSIENTNTRPIQALRISRITSSNIAQSPRLMSVSFSA